MQGFACLRHHVPGVLGRPFRLAAVADVPGPFQYLFRSAARLGGRIFLLGLPAGHVDALAGGLVIQRQAVAGHALRHLVTGFQWLHGGSPPFSAPRLIPWPPRLTGSS